MPEETSNTVQSESSHEVSNISPQEPIVSITHHSHRLTIVVGLVLVALIAATFSFAYSQGMLGGSGTSYTASSSTINAAPVVVDEVKSLQDNSTQIGSDLQGLDQATTDLNNIDTSGDQPPAF